MPRWLAPVPDLRKQPTYCQFQSQQQEDKKRNDDGTDYNRLDIFPQVNKQSNRSDIEHTNHCTDRKTLPKSDSRPYRAPAVGRIRRIFSGLCDSITLTD
jgi:hypothetical protein